jgi:hypothetical protein
VVPACNPSYSGDRDQEDRGLKSAWANSLQDPISKKSSTKSKVDGVVQGCRLSSNLSTTKKKSDCNVLVHIINL